MLANQFPLSKLSSGVTESSHPQSSIIGRLLRTGPVKVYRWEELARNAGRSPGHGTAAANASQALAENHRRWFKYREHLSVSMSDRLGQPLEFLSQHVQRSEAMSALLPIASLKKVNSHATRSTWRAMVESLYGGLSPPAIQLMIVETLPRGLSQWIINLKGRPSLAVLSESNEGRGTLCVAGISSHGVDAAYLCSISKLVASDVFVGVGEVEVLWPWLAAHEVSPHPLHSGKAPEDV